MAGTNSNSGKQTKFYSLKAKVDATNTPYFGLAEKNADNKWVIAQKFDTMSGFLVSGEIKEKDFEGAKTNIFVLTMEDDNETSKVELTHNSITHSLINTLATDCNKINTYAIQVYRKQSKDKQYWNGGVSVKVNGSEEGMKWSLDPQSAPKKIPVMIGDKPFLQLGKQVYDSTALKEFWEKVFIEKIQNVLKGSTASSATNNANTNNSMVSDATVIDESLDLPF